VTQDAEQIRADRADYLAFVAQLGVAQPVIDAIVHIDDLVPMPPGFAVQVRASPIHGEGLFALKAFAPGAPICPGRLGGHRTPAGRFINHSSNPNMMWVRRGDDLEAVAVKAIDAGDEITLCYRAAVRLNFGIDLPEPAVQERILTELVKLNKSVDQLRCFQLLGAKLHDEPDPGLGRAAGDAVARPGELSDPPAAPGAANHSPGHSHV
jgi:hypothetical protein